jgi:hypothetical protein
MIILIIGYDPMEPFRKAVAELNAQNSETINIALQSIRESNSRALREAFMPIEQMRVSMAKMTIPVNEIFRQMNLSLNETLKPALLQIEEMRSINLKVPREVIQHLELITAETKSLARNGHSDVVSSIKVNQLSESIPKGKAQTWNTIAQYLVLLLSIYATFVLPYQSGKQMDGLIQTIKQNHQEDKEQRNIQHREKMEQDERHHQEKMQKFDSMFADCVSEIHKHCKIEVTPVESDQ